VTGSGSFDALAVGADIARRVGVKTVRDESLARFTTMRVGGTADLFAVAHNAFELRGCQVARARSIPLFIPQQQLVIATGFCGLVVRPGRGIRVEGDRYPRPGCHGACATETQKAGLAGLEFGLAIPGTVGGAVWANAGAHGSDVAGVLESVTVLLADGSERVMATDELGFAYRDSRFKVATSAAAGTVVETPAGSAGAGSPAAPAIGPAEIVLAAIFRLRPAEAAEIKARLDDIRRWRQEHQPLGVPSAGSVFRNPPGDSAGRLIDALGLKGTRVGGAVVSDKHANFIVNDGKGTAADVRRLAERVRAEVRARHGLDLVFEVEFVGDWSGWTTEEA
jgi:UDP-N-acetylmuramate dehydrogenase